MILPKQAPAVMRIATGMSLPAGVVPAQPFRLRSAFTGATRLARPPRATGQGLDDDLCIDGEPYYACGSCSGSQYFAPTAGDTGQAGSGDLCINGVLYCRDEEWPWCDYS
jgi:hypothetical protein